MLFCATKYDHVDIFQYICETWFDLNKHDDLLVILKTTALNKNIKCLQYLFKIIDTVDNFDHKKEEFFALKILLGKKSEIKTLLEVKPSLINIVNKDYRILEYLIRQRNYDIIYVLKKYNARLSNMRNMRYYLSKIIYYIFLSTRALTFSDQIINSIVSVPINKHDDLRPLFFVQGILLIGFLFCNNKFISRGAITIYFFNCFTWI